MLQFEHQGQRLCDGYTRREWLRLGSLGAIGFSLPQWFRSQARAESTGTARPSARAKACVQLFLWGGPGAQETWDMKPHAPEESRGAFRPIATSVPGFQICEHMPLLAQRAHKYTIIRSQTHTGTNHGTSAYHMLTGHIHWSPGTLRHPTRQDMPNLGSNVSRFLSRPDYLPPHVQLPAIINDGDGLPVPGQDPGILGEQYTPFRVLGDLTQPDFQVPSLTLAEQVTPRRLQQRRSLQELIGTHAEYLSRGELGQAVDSSYQRALQLLQSEKTQQAFDLSQESPALREQYGRHHFAQALVLARRLVEAGVPFVTVYWNSPSNTDNQSWDTHTNQHERMGKHLLPPFDRALSAFLDDLETRGLLDDTLVTWWGEFGRTPKINRNGGRDHWGFCQSVGLAGAGVKQGLVYGSSTKDGGYPETCPVSPDDLSATVFQRLGVDWKQHMYDLQNRPVPLSYGEPVTDVLA